MLFKLCYLILAMIQLVSFVQAWWRGERIDKRKFIARLRKKFSAISLAKRFFD